MDFWNLAVVLGFGLVAISSFFLSIVFFRAWRDDGLRHDARYRTLSGALSVGKLGILLWALNPILETMGHGGLPLALLVLASGLVLGAAISVIATTALETDGLTLKLFLQALLELFL